MELVRNETTGRDRDQAQIQEIMIREHERVPIIIILSSLQLLSACFGGDPTRSRRGPNNLENALSLANSEGIQLAGCNLLEN